jgi:hypothetical protein
MHTYILYTYIYMYMYLHVYIGAQYYALKSMMVKPHERWSLAGAVKPWFTDKRYLNMKRYSYMSIDIFMHV